MGGRGRPSTGSGQAQAAGSIFPLCHLQAGDRWVPRSGSWSLATGLRSGPTVGEAAGIVRPRAGRGGLSCLGRGPNCWQRFRRGFGRAAVSARRQTPGQDTCGETVRAHLALWGFSMSASKTNGGGD